MSYKEIVLNYIKTHDVYELIFRINYRLNINSCAVRGYESGYIPMRYADLIVSDNILKVLDKIKKKEV